MKEQNVKITPIYKNNGKSFKALMSEILQSEAILNSIFLSNNINLKVVNSCQKKNIRRD